jgi:putative ABC transport system permease protein
MMRYLLSMACKSAWNRRLTLGLIAVVIALSVALLIGVERVRHDAREAFSQSVSGTDLIVGARTSPVQLMLYAIFRIGEPNNNMRWTSFESISAHPSVAWAVPLSLGDSHRGYPVLGTSSRYFLHYRYGADQLLTLTSGQPFVDGVDGVFDAVLGAEVAAKLGYQLGDRIVLSHGVAGNELGVPEHADKPFKVVGILARTGTPVDRTVHVNLAAMEAIHLDWQGGARLPGLTIPAEYVRKFDLQPKQITAVLVGLKNRTSVFKVQRWVHQFQTDPLLAVLPGIALDQLWQVVGVLENVLLLISGMVTVVGLVGLVAVMLAGLNERRRELAILRSVGARPTHIFLLLSAESLLITVVGMLSGMLLLNLLMLIGGAWVQSHYGVSMGVSGLRPDEIPLLVGVLLTGLLASVIPAYRACRLSLADGLTPRI